MVKRIAIDKNGNPIEVKARLRYDEFMSKLTESIPEHPNKELLDRYIERGHEIIKLRICIEEGHDYGKKSQCKRCGNKRHSHSRLEDRVHLLKLENKRLRTLLYFADKMASCVDSIFDKEFKELNDKEFKELNEDNINRLIDATYRYNMAIENDILKFDNRKRKK